MPLRKSDNVGEDVKGTSNGNNDMERKVEEEKEEDEVRTIW